MVAGLNIWGTLELLYPHVPVFAREAISSKEGFAPRTIYQALLREEGLGGRKEVITRATKSTSHGNRYSVVSSVSDLGLMVKLLVEDAVFDDHPARGNNESEFTDLFFRGTRAIAAGGPLALYQRKARGNWKLRVSLHSELRDTEIGKESGIDATSEKAVGVPRYTYQR